MFSSSMFVFLAAALVSLTRAMITPNPNAASDSDSVRVGVTLRSTTDCLYRIREAALYKGSGYLNNQRVSPETLNSMHFGPYTPASLVFRDAQAVNISLAVYHNNLKVSTLYIKGALDGHGISSTLTANQLPGHVCYVTTPTESGLSNSANSQLQGDNVRFDTMLSKNIDLECREIMDDSTTYSSEYNSTAPGSEYGTCSAHGKIYSGQKTCIAKCTYGCTKDIKNCGSFKKCEQLPNPGESLSSSADADGEVEPFAHNYKCHCNFGQ